MGRLDLILIRHAIAEDRLEFAKCGMLDEHRPLQKKGIVKFSELSLAYSRLISQPKLIVTSPYKRAEQTAEILLARFPNIEIQKSDALVPEAEFEHFLPVLEKYAEKQVLIAVGHEPHLSGLASWLLAGHRPAFLSLKKGGAIALQFNGRIEKNSAELKWCLAPKQVFQLVN